MKKQILFFGLLLGLFSFLQTFVYETGFLNLSILTFLVISLASFLAIYFCIGTYIYKRGKVTFGYLIKVFAGSSLMSVVVSIVLVMGWYTLLDIEGKNSIVNTVCETQTEYLRTIGDTNEMYILDKEDELRELLSSNKFTFYKVTIEAANSGILNFILSFIPAFLIKRIYRNRKVNTDLIEKEFTTDLVS